MTLEASSGNYVDDSATCSDQIDGYISENVQASGQVVDLSSPSEYKLVYHCANAYGATAVEKTRTVWVVAGTAAPTSAPTISCPAGKHYNDGQCAACLDGQFAPAGSASCIACSPGTYIETTGEACLVCDHGQYAATSGSTSCIACSVGRYAYPSFASTECRDAVPVIEILGQEHLTVEASPAGEANYVDDSATCSDQVDGLISESMHVTGNVVDVSVPGEYQITYHCTSHAGVDAPTKTRTVWVVQLATPAPSVIVASDTAPPTAATTAAPTVPPTAVDCCASYCTTGRRLADADGAVDVTAICLLFDCTVCTGYL
jgi:hypothetical protein